MGRPTGFIEIQRRGQPARPPLDRIRDWSEAHPRLSDGELADQGARCMDCGVPFCHTGVVISGMASGCPINNLIPEWNVLVSRGQWCEASCTVGLDGEPVAIKTIEQEIADRAWEEGWITSQPPLARTGHRVAVVGSGPAGLAAADQLNKAGHAVTVFERSGRIGGLLTYGIPNMKLGKDVVTRRVTLLEQEGVEFRTGVTVGADTTADAVLAEFDAVILATGATV